MRRFEVGVWSWQEELSRERGRDSRGSIVERFERQAGGQAEVQRKKSVSENTQFSEACRFWLCRDLC